MILLTNLRLYVTEKENSLFQWMAERQNNLDNDKNGEQMRRITPHKRLTNDYKIIVWKDST